MTTTAGDDNPPSTTNSGGGTRGDNNNNSSLNHNIMTGRSPYPRSNHNNTSSNNSRRWSSGSFQNGSANHHRSNLNRHNIQQQQQWRNDSNIEEASSCGNSSMFSPAMASSSSTYRLSSSIASKIDINGRNSDLNDENLENVTLMENSYNKSTCDRINSKGVTKDVTKDQGLGQNEAIRKLVQKLISRGSDSASSAVFYASALHARLASSRKLKAYDTLLYARALVSNEEYRRAVHLLERSGLIIGRLAGEVADTISSSLATYSIFVENDVTPSDCIEAALLAAHCLSESGDLEGARVVLEESCRYPFPTDKDVRSSMQQQQMQQHFPLIENAFDDRVSYLLKEMSPSQGEDDIHPLSRIFCAKGKLYDRLGNPGRSVSWLRRAVEIDVCCVEAMEYLIDRHLMSIDEEKTFLSSLDASFDGCGKSIEWCWLRDMYFARWNGLGSESSISREDLDVKTKTSVYGSDGLSQFSFVAESMMTPKFSFDVAGANPSPLAISETPMTGSKAHVAKPEKKSKSNAFGLSNDGIYDIDEAFGRLQLDHNLGKSAEVMSMAAHRAYALNCLPLASHYCMEAQRIDPLCPNHQFLHVAALLGLKKKEDLFRVAHQLVEINPKAPVSWYAVGCYYQLIGNFELAQRNFGRSTRLDPRCVESWIAFGCSFAATDESDQALAAFRAAQRLHNGGHHAILYMGMEYLRTNHLSLASHFLNASKRLNPNDPLCYNELGLCAYRQNDYNGAVSFFSQALKLVVKLDLQADNYMNDFRGKVHRNPSQIKADFGIYSQKPPLSCRRRRYFHGNYNNMTTLECVHHCSDSFWEPTIFNLGQCYRKARRFEEAKVCFEKSIVLSPVSLTLSYYYVLLFFLM